MVALARVTHDLAEARGPDVACSIEVPVAWFEAGATLQIQLPRLIQCARCEGGGCDACSRRGAFEQQAAGIPSEVEIVLPKQAAEGCAPIKLRLPALGARATEPRVAPRQVAAQTSGAGEAEAELLAELSAEIPAPAAGEGEATAEGAVEAEQQPELPPELPPGHLLLTIIPHPPDPTWLPPANVQALVLAAPPLGSWGSTIFQNATAFAATCWAKLRPLLELLLFPDRLAAAFRAWWQTPARSGARPVWIWAALAVLTTVLCFWLLTRSGFWLLTRSGSRSQ